MDSISGANVTRSFVLHTSRHRHLIRFLDEVQAQDPRGLSRVIREALELYIAQRRGMGPNVDIEAACERAIR